MMGADNLRKVAGYEFVLFCFHPVTSKCGSWYADCRALCPGPSSQEDRTLAARSKKKSSPEDEVWCQNHVGGSWPTMTALTEPARGEGTWLVFACWSQGATLHKQVQAAGWWHERGFAYWWKYYSMAGLECCSWPYSAIMQTWPTISVSWWKGDYSCHVYPNRRGRTSHFPSIYSHSAWCIDEGTEEEKARWGQCPGWVVITLWASPDWHAWLLSSLILAALSRNVTSAWVTLIMHGLATVGHKIQWMAVWYSTSCWRGCESRGIELGTR